MQLINSLAYRLIIASSIITASIAFLTSCATRSSSTPGAPVSPVSQEDQPALPPPPYVPYESRPGEAANVQKVLDSIQRNRHNDAPRSRPSTSSPSTYPHLPGYPAKITSPSASPRLPGYPANLTITNETNCKLGFYLQGPTSRELGLEVGKSVKLDIAAGSYQFGVDTHLCAGKVPPLFGKDVFEAGSSYTLTLSQEDIQPKMGNFVVENNTGAKLTVKVGGTTHTVASGSSSIELAEGSYTAVISAKCGTVSDSFDITKGSSYMGKYWCTGGEVITRPPEIGYFDVDNDTGAPLTIKVGGKSYKVQRGSFTIELPEGSYTAKISARCGSTSENLEIEAGSRYSGHYSCVSY